MRMGIPYIGASLAGLLLAPMMAAAQGTLIVPPGSKGTLTVEYVYISKGKDVSSSKDRNNDWDVKRTVSVTAQMQASGPQPMSAFRQDVQQAQQKKMETTAASVMKKSQPTMDDMMKIAERCGDDEACITKAIHEYGNNMSAGQKADLKSAKDEMQGAMGGDAMHYQMWQLTSQQGTYSLDETYHKQVFEMTCNPCKSEETRKGSGPLTLPPGTKAGSGAAFFEVDSNRKDMVVMLPVPIMPLPYTRTLATNLPDDDQKSGVSKGLTPNFMSAATKQFVVAIPKDMTAVSGTQTFKLTGAGGEGGTLTANWKFARN